MFGFHRNVIAIKFRKNFLVLSQFTHHLRSIRPLIDNCSTMSGTTARVPTVLLSCGSFNPITNMHLRMFELARDHMHRNTQHQVIEGVISPTNDKYQEIQKAKRLEKAERRCQMARVSLTPIGNEQHWVRVDDWEATQDHWTRTREAMDYFFEKVYDRKVSLKLLCGADMFHTFNVPDLWKDEDIHKIVGQYGMVVITREGSDPFETIERSPKSDILKKYRNNIFVVEEKIPNLISSTAIRNAIKNGESVRYLIPDQVIQYIKDNNLYKI